MAQEDDLAGKLESYGFPDPQTLAETMNDAGIDLDTLEEIHKGLSDKTFVPVMRWLCNILISSRVIKEIEEDQNMALAILIGSVFIGISLIISASISG